MWDHHIQEHGLTQTVSNDNFQFHIVKTFRDPMTRQIKEASRIQLALNRNFHEDPKGANIPIVSFNRKSEYFAARKRFDPSLT